MAKLTKAQARTLVQAFLDDPGAKLWSAATLDTLIEGALDELWGDLLENFQWLRSQETTVLTPVAPGTVNLDTALTRFYRVQQVVRGSAALNLVDQRDVLVTGSTEISAPAGSYTIMGGLLWMFPLSVAPDVYVRYSSRPTSFTTLLDSDPVEWPDGYHLAYCYDAASRALEKGNREDSTMLGKRAEQGLYRLKAYLRKQTIGPITPWSSMDSMEFGSIT